MKKKLLILIFGLVWLFLAGELLAKGPSGSTSITFYKPGQGQATQTLANLNNWSFWLRNNGESGFNFLTNQGGGVYPRGTATCVYRDGFIWGGVVTQSHFTQTEGRFRVDGQFYVTGTAAGRIEQAGTTTTPPKAADPNTAYIYRIRRDWESLKVGQTTVIQDAAELLNKSAANVTNAEQQAVIDDYQWAWENWPGDLGAPYYDLDDNGSWDPGVDEPGLADADQVTWFVYNDLATATTTSFAGSQPIGLEVQTTLWTYNQPGTELGQVIFKSSLIINKSGFPIDSMFVAQWCDPDVGVYTDDLVGCDPPRSVGFAYTGNTSDADYSAFNIPPASMGYDFFQGPIVESPGDTAIFQLQYRPGFRNLPQYSFGYFAAGADISDPSQGDYEGTLEWYNLLNGYLPTADTLNPVPFTHGFGPDAGQETRFPVDGDPVAGIGDLDGFGDNLAAGDRRMTLSAGPFTMQPGDSQEVVVGIIGGIVRGQGGNNRNAVAQLKLNDDFAQFIFNRLFEGIPKPPVAPDVTVTPLKDKIALEWGSNYGRIVQTEAKDTLLGFNFEGYNIYQFSSEAKDNPTKVATIDLDNPITTINGFRFVPEFGDVLKVPIQKGTNTGIQRRFILEKDYINDLPLYPGNKYYFGVTAYNAKDENNNGIVDEIGTEEPNPVPVPSLESGVDVPIIIIPQSPRPGLGYTQDAGDQIVADHSVGSGNATVYAQVADPNQLQTANYKVTFDSDTTHTSDTTFTVANSWTLWKGNQPIIEKNTDLDNLIDEVNTNMTDGFVLKIGELTFETPTTYLDITTTGDGTYDLDDYTAFGGIETGYAVESWGSGTTDVLRLQDDIEFRFTGEYLPPTVETVLGRPVTLFRIKPGTGSIATMGGARLYDIADHPMQNDVSTERTAEGYFAIRVPFEVWDIDKNEQINIVVYDRLQDIATADTFYAFNPFDRMYTWTMDTPYEGELTDPDGANANDLTWNQVFFLAEWVKGDVVTYEYANPIIAGSDEYTFSTKAPIRNNVDLAKAEVEKINVFPNPYYAFNPEETSRFDRKVTFTHLPQKATIRIFSLGGALVRKIEKDSESQFQDWNLRNERDLPVASGMYIVHVQMPDPINMEKTMKLFLVQGAEILKTY